MKLKNVLTSIAHTANSVLKPVAKNAPAIASVGAKALGLVAAPVAIAGTVGAIGGALATLKPHVAMARAIARGVRGYAKRPKALARLASPTLFAGLLDPATMNAARLGRCLGKSPKARRAVLKRLGVSLVAAGPVAAQAELFGVLAGALDKKNKMRGLPGPSAPCPPFVLDLLARSAYFQANAGALPMPIALSAGLGAAPCSSTSACTRGTMPPLAGGLGQDFFGPNMTIEDRMALALMMIMKNMDKDIDDQTNEIARAQQGQGKEGQGPQSIDTMSMKLQRLVEKRSQMFDTLRHVMERYNQTAKGAIDGIGRP